MTEPNNPGEQMVSLTELFNDQAWRPRRYELSREIAHGLACSGRFAANPHDLAETAVKTADALIEMLRRGPRESQSQGGPK